MFNGGGVSLADIAAVTGRNDGFGGGDGIWAILLLALLGRNGLWGGGGSGDPWYPSSIATAGDIQRGFDTQEIVSKLNGLENGLCDGFYAMNTGMLNGFNGVENGIQNATASLLAQLNNMAANEAACCCQTQNLINTNFADLNYNLATQECQTRQAIADGTRNIIDAINAQAVAAKDEKIADQAQKIFELQLAASQQAQNNYIINALQPVARPAYVVPNPYANYGFGCNCNAI